MMHTANVQEDDEGLFVEFNPEMLATLGWGEGDRIRWTDNGDGTWTLSKVPEKTWVMVDTISQYRMRYLVEVPASNPEWALDTVVCEEAKEFSQQWIGEQVLSHRIVTEAEALEICDVDNDYCKSWDSETKKRVFFTPVKDEVKHSEHYFDTERNK